MPFMMGQSTPTTSMSLQTRSGQEEKMVSRTPRRSACVEEAELFENWWAEIAADFKMEEETFSKEDLSNLRRLLELWQSAVEATIREKVIREVVHKLSPDHSQQPSPFADDEEEHTDEPDEPWITETPEEAEEYLEEKKTSTSGTPPGYDEDWCGPWEGGDDALEEETPDEAEEYVEDFSKTPAEAEEYLNAPEEATEYPKKPRDAPAWYDEDWCGPWEGSNTVEDIGVPEEAKKHSREEEWNPWEAPTNEPSSWQQQVDAAQHALAQYHEANAPVPMDFSAGRGQVKRRGPSKIRSNGPFVDLRVCFHCGMEGHIRPRCPNRDKPRRRACAEESPPNQGAWIEEVEEDSPEESLQEAWQRIKRARIAQAKKSRQQGRTNCHDYPEAHTWESRTAEDIEEEEAVRALVAAEDDSYLAYDEACKVRQLVSNMITRGRVPEAGRKVITGRARIT
ncbi:hypothetical protein EI94DRAFT_1704313 [Lactarius quietus]|nr:hypothetical protein EI94DRAFT_1704313 [Lactarius quietus]